MHMARIWMLSMGLIGLLQSEHPQPGVSRCWGLLDMVSSNLLLSELDSFIREMFVIFPRDF
jgi:hypothetical protein